MAATPIFGPFDVTRSTNFADNQCINLRPEVTQVKDGKNIGALYGTPGLDLLASVGAGPVQGQRPLGTLLYVVSGNDVFTVTEGWVATRLGAIVGNLGHVSMIDNGSQIAMFSDEGCWVGPPGFPLTGATIGNTGYQLTGGTINSGVNFAVGDTITLQNIGGTQTAAAILQVTAIDSNGDVTADIVSDGGIFPVQPTGFNQIATSGIGSGFTLTAPTYGPLIVGGMNYAVGDTVILEAVGGTQLSAAMVGISAVTNGKVTAFSILQTGAFIPDPTSLANPTSFIQKSTTGSGSGLVLTAPAYGADELLCRLNLPFSPAGGQTISAAYQDTFGICNQPGTMTLWQSLTGDLSVWPDLNFATADGNSDNVMAVKALHRLIHVVKQRSTEFWVNAGTSGFAFQPTGTVLAEYGTPSGESVARVGDSVVFLASNAQGQGMVRAFAGYDARSISTHAVETLLATIPDLSGAFAYAYQQEGHQFYVLTVGTVTLVYDRTESVLTGVPIWYQWLAFNAGNFERHWGNAFAFFNQTLVLGDYRNGNLYRINLNTLTDNGSPRKWLRSWRALQVPVMQPMRFSSLQIDMQTGVDVPDDAQVMLEWSDDGGHSWSGQRLAAVGVLGATAQRVRFNRLGSTRRNSGLDRTFRLSSSSPIPVCLVGAELDV